MIAPDHDPSFKPDAPSRIHSILDGGELRIRRRSLKRKGRMNDLLPMTLRAILGGMVRSRVCIHRFGALIEATGRGRRGLDLSWNCGLYDVIFNSVSGSLHVLRDGETRTRRSIGVLVDVGLSRICVWIAYRQRSGRRRLLRSVGERNRGDIVNVQVQASGRWLLLLRLIVALLLKGRSECRKDGLKMRLERLS